MPVIIGSNSDEGILNLAAYLQGNILFEEVDQVRKTRHRVARGRIFSHVRPFYEQAVSEEIMIKRQKFDPSIITVKFLLVST